MTLEMFLALKLNKEYYIRVDISGYIVFSECYGEIKVVSRMMKWNQARFLQKAQFASLLKNIVTIKETLFHLILCDDF